jgi:hypothetical protein
MAYTGFKRLKAAYYVYSFEHKLCKDGAIFKICFISKWRKLGYIWIIFLRFNLNVLYEIKAFQYAKLIPTGQLV